MGELLPDSLAPSLSPHDHDPLTMEVLQGSLDLLAEKERLETERQRLIDVDRMKSAFLARVSHDLRTPLSSIIGFSDLLNSGAEGRLNKRQLELVEAIARNGRTLLSQINDLLDLSTIESGQFTLRREAVEVETVVADVLAAVAPLMTEARLIVAWPEPADIAGRTVRIDRRRVVQALINLMDNARKFTPAGGRVALRVPPANRTGAPVRFIVEDSGLGIPPEDHEKVFKPFFQRSGTSNDGVGLGLAIVKGIAELHGGRIDLWSETGRGARFTMTLPENQPIDPSQYETQREFRRK
ncbi:hypothetical protein LBMAG53_30790 [Planctomycetota bacterium]|nr:hypothetical protein LBMAG53_30790 [Planctomycetota bacterium]